MRVFAVKRFYHTSPALSTPHRRSLGHPHPPHLPLSYGDFRGLENENSYTMNRELHDLAASLGTLGITVGVEQRELRGRGHRPLLPEPFDGVVPNAVGQCIIDDPAPFPIRQPVVKAFEACEFLYHGVRHPVTGTRWENLDRVGEQTEHALLLK